MTRSAGIALGICLAAFTVTAERAVAQPAPKPVHVSDFPRATVERLGLEMYFHDQMAWQATDLLTEGKYDIKGLRGWIIVDQRPEFRVRFLREAGAGIEAAYDVVFDGRSKPSVSKPADPSLSDTERAQFEAVRTARDDVPGYCVQEPYNTVVLPIRTARAGWFGCCNR